MWEVAIVVDTAARQPVATGVEGADLERAILEANRRIRTGEYLHPAWKTGAVLVQRVERTTEERFLAWVEKFYDITKNGAKRRRYKVPAIEREWVAWVTGEKKAAREAAKHANAGRRRSRDGS